jgi:hypothetical protein
VKAVLVKSLRASLTSATNVVAGEPITVAVAIAPAYLPN